MEVKAFESLIHKLLVDGRKYLTYECNSLLDPGENFGSSLMSVNIYLETREGKEECVQCVLKLLPPKVMWKIINPPATFKYEIMVYTKLVPMLNDFITKCGGRKLMCFATCIGARMCLDPDVKEIDENAAILLEDLKIDKYSMGNKLIGFEKTSAEMLLRDLAKLHSIPIAFKQRYPMEFKDQMLPLIKRAHSLLFRKETMAIIWNNIKEELLKYPEGSLFLVKLRKAIDEAGIRKCERYNSEAREPFATLIHYDFWTNNMMVKFENGNPVSTKILDFQMCDYNIPASDVLFFLYTSVKLGDLKGNLDYFLRFYYNQLMLSLSEMNCSTDQFPYDIFYKDVEYASRFELLHVILKGSAIFATKENAKDLNKINTDKELFPKKMHENFILRLLQISSDFVERGWL